MPGRQTQDQGGAPWGKYPQSRSSQTRASHPDYSQTHEIIQNQKENEIPDPYLLIAKLQKAAQLICQGEEIAWVGMAQSHGWDFTTQVRTDPPRPPPGSSHQHPPDRVPTPPKIPGQPGWVSCSQTQPGLALPKVTRGPPKAGGMGQLCPLKVKMKHEKYHFQHSRPLSHQEGSKTPDFVTATDANQVDEEKETKPTLKIPACRGGCRKHGAGGERSETRSRVSMLIHETNGREIKKFRMRRMSESPGRVKRIGSDRGNPAVSPRPPPPRKLLQIATSICTGRACVPHRRDQHPTRYGEKRAIYVLAPSFCWWHLIFSP